MREVHDGRFSSSTSLLRFVSRVKLLVVMDFWSPSPLQRPELGGHHVFPAATRRTGNGPGKEAESNLEN